MTPLVHSSLEAAKHAVAAYAKLEEIIRKLCIVEVECDDSCCAILVSTYYRAEDGSVQKYTA